MASQSIIDKLSPAAQEQLSQFLPAAVLLCREAIAYAQFGIIMSGLVSIAAGLLVRLAGRNAVEKILPPTITGPVAMIIGAYSG